MRSCLIMAFLVSTSCLAQDKPDAPAAAGPEFKSVSDKISYAIGMNIGRNLKQQGIALNIQILAEGISAVVDGKPSALSDSEIAAAFQQFQAEQEKAQEEKATANDAAAAKFLVENATKEGVQKTKSGLQYIVIKEGTGEVPKVDSTVTTHYRGKLMDGKVFDQSFEGEMPTDADEPASFGVSQVIKGWTEALQMMKVGSTYRLFVPPALAYGKNGPPSIGPNSLLIFEVHLISAKN